MKKRIKDRSVICHWCSEPLPAKQEKSAICPTCSELMNNALMNNAVSSDNEAIQEESH